jgi:hypothetical protein
MASRTAIWVKPACQPKKASGFDFESTASGTSLVARKQSQPQPSRRSRANDPRVTVWRGVKRALSPNCPAARSIVSGSRAAPTARHDALRAGPEDWLAIDLVYFIGKLPAQEREAGGVEGVHKVGEVQGGRVISGGRPPPAQAGFLPILCSALRRFGETEPASRHQCTRRYFVHITK